jgi:TctA family transporter
MLSAGCGDVALDAAWQGLALMLSWPNILYPLAGTLAAMVVALLPGISGAAR